MLLINNMIFNQPKDDYSGQIVPYRGNSYGRDEINQEFTM